MEGKITKINLTSDKKLFDQQTIMNLKANDKNKRLKVKPPHLKALNTTKFQSRSNK